ncbi:uncharacterized protein LOC127869936 [Dreissena polymorpha]|nr:uncharacterized protein LOC127869936 [Dreissena polymorpha]
MEGNILKNAIVALVAALMFQGLDIVHCAECCAPYLDGNGEYRASFWCPQKCCYRRHIGATPTETLYVKELDFRFRECCDNPDHQVYSYERRTCLLQQPISLRTYVLLTTAVSIVTVTGTMVYCLISKCQNKIHTKNNVNVSNTIDIDDITKPLDPFARIDYPERKSNSWKISKL